MASPARHLQVVDTSTGDVLPECPDCKLHEQTYKELERKYKGLLSQLGRMRADKRAEAQRHAAWPEIAGLFLLWRDECNHPRSPFTPERFWQGLPRLEDFGRDFLALAIWGAATDPFLGEPRKNGTRPRYDDWELIMRSPEKTEDFARRAPWLMIQESTWELHGNQWRLKLKEGT